MKTVARKSIDQETIDLGKDGVFVIGFPRRHAPDELMSTTLKATWLGSMSSVSMTTLAN